MRVGVRHESEHVGVRVPVRVRVLVTVGVAVRVAVLVMVGVAAVVSSPAQVLPFISLLIVLGQMV